MSTKKKSTARRARIPAGEVIAQVPMQSTLRASFSVLAIVLGLLCVIFLQRVIVLFLLGLLLSSVMDPAVQYMKRWKIHTSLAVLILYFVFIAFTIGLILALIPIISEQLEGITALTQTEGARLLTEKRIALPFLPPEINFRLTQLLRYTLQSLSLEGRGGFEQLNVYLSSMAAGSLTFLATMATTAVSFIWNTFLVLLFAFFLQIERRRAYEWVRKLMPAHLRPYADERSGMIRHRLGQWIRGQLLLCLCIGALTFIVLLLLRVPYALTLAILAGFTEFIPYVGPLIGAVPAVLIALAHGGFMWALVVAGAFYLIQFAENNVFVPMIMKRTVELSAVSIMFAMMVGVSFPTVIHPILGILISVPLAGISDIFLNDIRQWQRSRTVIRKSP